MDSLGLHEKTVKTTKKTRTPGAISSRSFFMKKRLVHVNNMSYNILERESSLKNFGRLLYDKYNS
jgi:hypothetical protein